LSRISIGLTSGLKSTGTDFGAGGSQALANSFTTLLEKVGNFSSANGLGGTVFLKYSVERSVRRGAVGP
jgi:hypothetical protein